MSLARVFPHVVAYDIADPRRLARVHRALKRWGVPIQYSVFLCPLSAGKRKVLTAELESLIDPAEDDIRIYPLPQVPWSHRYGRGTKQEGHTLAGLADGGLLGQIESQVHGDADFVQPWLQDTDQSHNVEPSS